MWLHTDIELPMNIKHCGWFMDFLDTPTANSLFNEIQDTVDIRYYSQPILFLPPRKIIHQLNNWVIKQVIVNSKLNL